MWQSEIIKAIESKTLIEVVYKSQRRLVGPHVLGVIKSKIELRAWQLKNYSDALMPEEWRTFEIKKITSLTNTENFFSGPRYTKSSAHENWDRIIAKVV